MPSLKRPCNLCQKPCKNNQKCIQCNICNSWIHLVCSKLTINQLNYYTVSNDCYYCKLCMDSILPFQSLENLKMVNSNETKTITKKFIFTRFCL